jgi:hypothetical protein
MEVERAWRGEDRRRRNDRRHGAGKARITATDAPATTSVPVQVVANTIADIELTPRKLTARTGDVVRFGASPKDASGKTIAGLTPTWSFSPGKGQIDPDGGFVAYEAGSYVVTASYVRAPSMPS